MKTGQTELPDYLACLSYKKPADGGWGATPPATCRSPAVRLSWGWELCSPYILYVFYILYTYILLYYIHYYTEYYIF